MIKSTLDFTDDIRDIIKRILVMRRDLKKAKIFNDSYNNKSIYISHNYKNYDQKP